jgi:hypothetical protein
MIRVIKSIRNEVIIVGIFALCILHDLFSRSEPQEDNRPNAMKDVDIDNYFHPNESL